MVNIECAKRDKTGYNNFPSGCSEFPVLFYRQTHRIENKYQKDCPMNRTQKFRESRIMKKMFLLAIMVTAALSCAKKVSQENAAAEPHCPSPVRRHHEEKEPPEPVRTAARQAATTDENAALYLPP